MASPNARLHRSRIASMTVGNIDKASITRKVIEHIWRITGQRRLSPVGKTDPCGEKTVTIFRGYSQEQSNSPDENEHNLAFFHDVTNIKHTRRNCGTIKNG